MSRNIIPNVRVLGQWPINYNEIIDVCSFASTRTPIVLVPQVSTSTFIATSMVPPSAAVPLPATGSLALPGPVLIRAYLGPALAATIKKITVQGSFQIELWTDTKTFLLGADNTPTVLTWSPVASEWVTATSTTLAFAASALPSIQRGPSLLAQESVGNIRFGSALAYGSIEAIDLFAFTAPGDTGKGSLFLYKPTRSGSSGNGPLVAGRIVDWIQVQKIGVPNINTDSLSGPCILVGSSNTTAY
jgi:hypothetical protein